MYSPVCTQAWSCQEMYRPFCFYRFFQDLRYISSPSFNHLFYYENDLYEFLYALVGEESSSLKEFIYLFIYLFCFFFKFISFIYFFIYLCSCFHCLSLMYSGNLLSPRG